MSIAVALAGDSLIMREGVAGIVAAQPAMRVVASCGELPSLLAVVETASPAITLPEVGFSAMTKSTPLPVIVADRPL